MGYVSQKQWIPSKFIHCIIFLPGNGKVSCICAFFMNSFDANFIFFFFFSQWRETATVNWQRCASRWVGHGKTCTSTWIRAGKGEKKKSSQSMVLRNLGFLLFFFFVGTWGVKSKLHKSVLFIKRAQHCSGMTMLLPIKTSIDIWSDLGKTGWWKKGFWWIDFHLNLVTARQWVDISSFLRPNSVKV